MKQLILIVAFIVLVPACMTTTSTSATRSNLIPSQSPEVIPSPTARSIVEFETDGACQKLFLEATDLTEKARSNEDIVAIVDKVVEAGEYYLNNCTNPAKPLASQKDQLTELIEFAQVIPPYTKCATRYQPTIEVMDLNGKLSFRSNFDIMAELAER